MSEIDFIAEARRLCHDLEEMLPSFHSPSSETTFSMSDGSLIWAKLPSKLIAVAGSLAWRAHDFATLSLDLFESNRIIPGAVIARSLMETTALLYTVHKRTKDALATGHVEALDEFLVRCMSGNRLRTGEPESPNVLTAIQSLENENGAEGYLKFYESLCEFAHPNALGTFYAYASFHDASRMLVFGHNRGMTQGDDLSFAVVFALEVLLEFLTKLVDLLPPVTKLARDKCLQDIGKQAPISSSNAS